MSPTSRDDAKARQAHTQAMKQTKMVAGDELPPTKKQLEKSKKKRRKKKDARWGLPAARIREEYPISKERRDSGWRQ